MPAMVRKRKHSDRTHEDPPAGPPQDAPRPRPSRRRVWGFRLCAVLFALAPFVLAELLFVALDWGRPEKYDDPFVGFSAMHPLFVLSGDGVRYEVAESQYRCFRPDWFAAKKPADECRVFCLGGSTVQGRPYAIETSFTTWLELYLGLADTSRKWRVVNCGGISYASYRLVPILEEVLGHQPDLIVLYTGHNEFLEDREYGSLRDIPRWLAGPWELVSRTRTYTLLREGYLRVRGTSRKDAEERRTVLKADVEAILDYKGGLEKYHRDEAWRRGVIEHFHYNVRRMVQMCREAGVNVLLVDPVSNLRDCPPFKSEHRPGLTAEQLGQWRLLCEQSADYSGIDGERSIKLLREALAIDDQHAGLHYELAKELDAMADYRGAYAEYLRAKELDICPLRILEPMNRAILDIGRETGTPVVDVRELIETCSPDAIPGDMYLADHVHPRIAGHRLIADALVDELARQGIVHPQPGWRDKQEQRALDHIASLGYLYFSEGAERLEALRGWAAGRAELTPPKPEREKRQGSVVP